MASNGFKDALIKVATTVIGGVILAIVIRECRDIKATHDAVMRLEEHEKNK